THHWHHSIVCHILVVVIIFFFFFFQAEDGIRDGHVTGVQTCALPIWRASPPSPRRGGRGGRRGLGGLARRYDDERRGEAAAPHRSEERRVGKEWRSRGWTGD